MRPVGQSENPEIVLTEDQGEVTLLIDGHQAMQGWERDLMMRSADLLCECGSEFLEVGLGLGISALHIARHRNTTRHVVWEKYQTVIDLFKERHPQLPPSLRIELADFFDAAETLAPSTLDGIFFDPWLPREIANDESLWAEIMPCFLRALRPEGVFIPFFTTQPVLKWPFRDYFSRVMVRREDFHAYPATEYTHGTAGQAYIQCFMK